MWGLLRLIRIFISIMQMYDLNRRHETTADGKTRYTGEESDFNSCVTVKTQQLSDNYHRIKNRFTPCFIVFYLTQFVYRGHMLCSF